MELYGNMRSVVGFIIIMIVLMNTFYNKYRINGKLVLMLYQMSQLRRQTELGN